MLKYLEEIRDGHPALGGCDDHRGLHRQSLHRRPSPTRRLRPVSTASSKAAAGSKPADKSDPGRRASPRPASRPRACPRRALLEKNGRREGRGDREARRPRSRQVRQVRRQAGRDREHSGRTAPAPADAARKGGRQGHPRPPAPAAPVAPPRRRQQRLRSRPRSRRKSAATPTILPAPRSSACAASGEFRAASARSRPCSRRLRASAARAAGRDCARASAPLPPPIMVSAPPSDTYDQDTQPKPPYAANADDPRRPTPPAEIPRRDAAAARSARRAAAEPRARTTNVGRRRCCRRRSRCSTPSCRRSFSPGPRKPPDRLGSAIDSAADAREPAARGFVARTKRDRAGIGGRGLGLVAEPFIGMRRASSRLTRCSDRPARLRRDRRRLPWSCRVRGSSSRGRAAARPAAA